MSQIVTNATTGVAYGANLATPEGCGISTPSEGGLLFCRRGSHHATQLLRLLLRQHRLRTGFNPSCTPLQPRKPLKSSRFPSTCEPALVLFLAGEVRAA